MTALSTDGAPAAAGAPLDTADNAVVHWLAFTSSDASDSSASRVLDGRVDEPVGGRVPSVGVGR